MRSHTGHRLAVGWDLAYGGPGANAVVLVCADVPAGDVMFDLKDLYRSRRPEVLEALRGLGDWEYQDEVIVHAHVPLPLLAVRMLNTD